MKKEAFRINGYIVLVLIIGLLILGAVISLTSGHAFFMIASFLFVCLISSGFVINQPKVAVAMVFMGKYLGTIYEDGFYCTIPFTSKSKVNLKAVNFNSDVLKVNDIHGNPIEIAAVVVYSVVDVEKALFDVADYQKFVMIQSETAIRHIATKYAYDTTNKEEYSLRGNAEEIADELQIELQERLQKSGVKVHEARLSHLAYAPEIASSMLQRQQAKAVVQAKREIVEGAVGMVEDALKMLEEKGLLTATDSQKADMVTSLLVTIISEKGAQPVISTMKK
ncbi:SPFH domain-containing protein [Gottfriedia sp. NPDC057991]|uniref:SPFH domain-containing protein n=1 Tax=Gottfriedia sp. NPDC057991 TaxID=3346298 RepID=UPI0036D93D46